MEQMKRWSALFSKIGSRDDAAKVVRDAVITLCVIIVSQAALDFITAPVWLSTRLLFPLALAILALALWVSNSRAIAIVFALVFLSDFIRFVLSEYLDPARQSLTILIADWSSISEILLSVLGLLASVRAIVATTTLRRQVASTEIAASSPSDTSSSAQSHSLLDSLIQRYPFAGWLTILFPPLLFIPLVFTPPDMTPLIILWFAAFIAFFASCWHIIKLIAGKFGGKMLSMREWLRPAFTILIIAAAIVLVAKSRHSADEFGRSLANLAQAQCNATGTCPTTLQVFTCSEVTFRNDGMCQFKTTYGEYGAQFLVFYTLPKDKKSFLVVVRHDMDSKLVFAGGVETELKETHQNH